MKNEKFNTEIFIKKSQELHGLKYDYQLVDYKNSDTKVKIICPIHGVFEQMAYSHYKVGAGCIRCAEKKVGESFIKNRVDFIKQANIVHNSKYLYQNTRYIGCKLKVDITCAEHGNFKQTPDNHLRGKGCEKCAIERRKKLKITTDDFIGKAILVHRDKYEYNETIYTGSSKKLKIFCRKHGCFEQLPYNHLKGKGCKKCKSSNGERKIRDFLMKNKINFIEQYTFKGCKNKISLPFDFYLPDYNLCIEFDGIQHRVPVKFFGGEVKFANRVKNDKLKSEYCETHNIRLIRIIDLNYIDNLISQLGI